MSYDFSFSPKAFFGTILCLAGLLIATFFAGVVVGTLRQSPLAKTSTPAPASPPKRIFASNKSAAANPAPSTPAQENATPPPTQEQASLHQEQRRYCLQYGIFQDKMQADQLLKDLSTKGVTASEATKEDQYKQSWIVIRSGDYATFEEASQSADILRPKLNQPVLVRPSASL